LTCEGGVNFRMEDAVAVYGCGYRSPSLARARSRLTDAVPAADCCRCPCLLLLILPRSTAPALGSSSQTADDVFAHITYFPSAGQTGGIVVIPWQLEDKPTMTHNIPLQRNPSIRMDK